MFYCLKNANPSFSTKKFLGVYLGNLFEHYDTALYSFLSPFFATLFFPKNDYIVALILSFAMIPIGKLAKPVGSLFFGYLSDTRGRKKAFVLSLVGMSVTTASIGLLPTYTSIGVLATFLLVCARLLQNFFAAGGISGPIYVIEEMSNEKDKDFISSLFSTSTIAGILIASFFVTLLYAFNCIETGWRFLYLIGLLTGLVGSYLRRQSNIQNETHITSITSQLKEIFTMRQKLVKLILVSGFSYSTYSMAFVLMNGFVPLVSTLTKGDIMTLNTYLLIGDFIMLPLFGKLTRFCSRETSMGLAASLAVISALPLFSMLDNCHMFALITVRVFVVIVGVWFSATQTSFAQNLFPKHLRVTGYSLAYSIGSQAFGSTTAAISLWIYHQTGIVSSIAWYWMLLAFMTSFVLFKETKEIKALKTNN